MSKIDPEAIFQESGMFAKSFPIINVQLNINEVDISNKQYKDLVEVSNQFIF